MYVFPARCGEVADPSGVTRRLGTGAPMMVGYYTLRRGFRLWIIFIGRWVLVIIMIFRRFSTNFTLFLVTTVLLSSF